MTAALSPFGRRVLWANLIAQAGIVVTGGVVRLTGSGLGCPTWPECVEGSYVATARQEEGWHSLIEFGNRTLTFVVGVLAIAALVVVLRARPRRRPLLLLAAVPLLGTFAQAVLGGITVLTGLNPVTVALHFLLSMVLIAASVVLVLRAGEDGDGPAVAVVRREIVLLARLLLAVTVVVVVLGTIVTGSGPHSGDAQAESRFPFDPRTVAWLHADAVLLFLGLTVGILVALRVTDAPARARRAAWLVLAIALAQGLIGYVQYFTGLPEVVVAAHLLGACLVWITVVALQLALRVRSAADATAGQRPLDRVGEPGRGA